MNKIADVCIVGAGPGGVLLAYLLAKQNVSVILIERHKEIGQAFRGEHLNEQGEEILKKYNLFEKIEQLGLLRMETLEYWESGKMVKEILPDSKVGHLGIHVPQSHLLSVIVEEASKYPHFTILTDTKVVDLLMDEDGYFNGVLASKGGDVFTIESSIVIGADGRFSTVRKKAGIDVTIRKHGYDLLWAKIPAPANWKPSIKMALVDGMQLSLFTQVNDMIQIGWNIPEGTFASIRKQPFEPFILKLTAAFPQLEQSVAANIRSWSDFVFLDVHSNYTDCWVKNGVALIGDAVHTMTPTGAFGLNSALMDAEILASILTKDQILEIELIQCAKVRKKEIEKIQALQIEKEQNFVNQFVIFS